VRLLIDTHTLLWAYWADPVLSADAARLLCDPLNEIVESRGILMSAVTLEEAKANLGALIERLAPGEEFLIVDQGRPLAQVKKAERSSWPCKAGSAAGKIHFAPDFDEPLDDFREYME
jgi:antitoxin (DNA-binding transcriptional repressor) of toxin-antitoxin stability system